jgi:hypothetical protein
VIDDCPAALTSPDDSGPWVVFGSPQADKGTCSGGLGDWMGPLEWGMAPVRHGQHRREGPLPGELSLQVPRPDRLPVPCPLALRSGLPVPGRHVERRWGVRALSRERSRGRGPNPTNCPSHRTLGRHLHRPGPKVFDRPIGTGAFPSRQARPLDHRRNWLPRALSSPSKQFVSVVA